MAESSAVGYACQVTACGKTFRSLRALLGHMHLQHSVDKKLGLTCGIDECCYYFNVVSSYRGHVRKRHASHWDACCGTPSIKIDVDPEVSDAEIDENLCHSDSQLSHQAKWDLFLNNFAQHLAIFRLKMAEAHSLPMSVVASIFQDLQSIFDIFQQQFADFVKSHMQHLGVTWTDDTIFREIFCQSSVFERCFSSIATEHLFSNFVSNKLKFNQPVRHDVCPKLEVISVECDANLAVSCDADTGCQKKAIASREPIAVGDGELDSLQDKTCHFHYVPILVTLKNYLEQPDVWASCNQAQVDDGKLRDFRDGIVWQNRVVKNNELFIRIHLYSDELELCNPLSNKRDNKLSAFYFLVGNLETKYWSSLTNIHLALLCNYNTVKRFGYDDILKPFLNDIKLLESDGILLEIEGEVHHVYGVVTFTGDNLTSHSLGGFNSCFSSGRICRQCMTSKLSIGEVLSESDCTLRTESGHLYHVNAVSNDPSLSCVYGVKGASPFTSLSMYNPVTFFPPDVMHDVLEGLTAVSVGLVVKSLVRQEKVPLKVINSRLIGFKFGIADKSDRFAPLPVDFVTKNRTIGGKAVEKWALFRLLPLLVGDLVPADNQHWTLYLLCREICEIILAPVIDPAWLPYLEMKIAHHHALLQEIAPQAFIPKIHFVTHYPRLLLTYGPLRHLWAMRFEATHQYFKQLIRKTRSHVNVTSVLATRFQRKKCYEMAANMLMSSALTVSLQRFLETTKLPTLLQHEIANRATFDAQIMSVKSVTVNGNKCSVGSVILYDVIQGEEDVPAFLSVKYILQFNNSWSVCGTLCYAARFDFHMHGYCVEMTDDWVILDAAQAGDRQCLSLYEKNSELVVILKHRVCRSASRPLYQCAQ
jgi:hypothetical protein